MQPPGWIAPEDRLLVTRCFVDFAAQANVELVAHGFLECGAGNRGIQQSDVLVVVGLDAARNTQGPEAPTKSGQTTIINLGDFAPPVDELGEAP